ncbi:MAG TPA: hypothetical protein ENI23_04175 [bacterium]|nr:hypothetical protein [bacterium]
MKKNKKIKIKDPLGNSPIIIEFIENTSKVYVGCNKNWIVFDKSLSDYIEEDLKVMIKENQP